MSAHDEKEELKPSEPQEIRMVITLTKEGAIKVETPVLFDKILCFGMLESAKMAIATHQVQPQNFIQPAKGGIVNFMRRNRL